MEWVTSSGWFVVLVFSVSCVARFSFVISPVYDIFYITLQHCLQKTSKLGEQCPPYSLQKTLKGAARASPAPYDCGNRTNITQHKKATPNPSPPSTWYKAHPQPNPPPAASHTSTSPAAASTLKSTRCAHPIANQTAYRDHKPD